MKLGGLLSLGTFTQWELTAAQRSFLLGPDKASGDKSTQAKKPTKRLTMDEMREKNRRDQERQQKRAKLAEESADGITAA